MAERKYTVLRPEIRTSKNTLYMATKTIDDPAHSNRGYRKPTKMINLPNKMKLKAAKRKSSGSSGG
jgi:hypothetical protein